MGGRIRGEVTGELTPRRGIPWEPPGSGERLRLFQR